MVGSETRNYSGVLTGFTEKLSFEDLPPKVVEKLKYLILDTVGVGISGSATDPGQMLIQIIRELGGPCESTLFGDGCRVNCVNASYVNAFLADILDYEDTLPGLSHPTAVIVSSALAVGEKTGATGKELVASVAAGYEAAARIARAVRPTPDRSTKVAVAYAWHGLGAAIAASKLMRLSKEGILDSLAYAASASPLPTWITGYGKPFHWIKNNFGEQAAAGTMGALLASRGYLCPRSILESEKGFWLMVGSDSFDPEKMIKDLGHEYVLMKAGFKPYAACRWIHTTLDALQSMLGEHDTHVEDIKEVVVHCSPETIALGFEDHRPQTLVDAEFSVPYTVAMVLLKEQTGLNWYTREKLSDPRILAIAAKVKLVGDLESFWTKGTHEIPVRVEVVLKNGTRLERAEHVPRGDPANPVSAEFLKDKFVDSVGQAGMSLDRAKKLLEFLSSLEDVTDLSVIGSMLKV
jgi:2-methylcitrate dehydratase PrpD